MTTTTKSLTLRRRLHLEVALEFGRHCKAELDEDALQKLGDAVDLALYNEFGKAGLQWDTKTRRFVLARVAEAARECGKRATAANGPVTPQIMLDVVTKLVPGWEAQCQLPPNAPPPADRQMGDTCPATVAALKGVTG